MTFDHRLFSIFISNVTQIAQITLIYFPQIIITAYGWKFNKIDDGVVCNCVPQLHAASKVSMLKQVLAMFLLNHHASPLMMLPTTPSQKFIRLRTSYIISQ